MSRAESPYTLPTLSPVSFTTPGKVEIGDRANKSTIHLSVYRVTQAALGETSESVV